MTGPAMSAGDGSSDGELVKLRYDLIELLARELESASLALEEHAGFLTRRLDELLAPLPLAEAVHAPVRPHVLDEFIGYGPIQPLTGDPEITEVMVNAPDNVYVGTGG